MKTLTKESLNQLLLDSHTIEKDRHGLKVVRLANGDFLKLYRRKRWLSSALWSPPAARFANNAVRLRKLGIAAPVIVEVLQIPELQINAVQYQPLSGETLRSHWRTLDENSRNVEVQLFGSFLGQLHLSGVYFRSLHFGNVLLLPDARFGLIDLSDMHVSNRPLSAGKRKRNLAHILRYKEEANWLAFQHLEALLAGYAEKCGPAAAAHLSKSIHGLHPNDNQTG
ncbi:polymerase [Stutzerimonas stutzeri]|uniref:lipopolysaccharide kinase InaA family protein n=1 Tax=Pseudomonadaceae TaxID=135621 RepID=UPI00066E2FFC|nr:MULTISPECIES: lipopolysaccharide kinase InaA family protein [Pseudomonadaceae]MBE7377210.1 polymerase [Pseudomonas lopnurensis]RRV83128.1 polymerase [Stutzerimonas stutzeri]RRV92954.1 polymerase [Stutzerimonas stutzeri]RRV94064.1 polymerase [Stutzerimonas stutzeri]RRV97480.1 polymerase [Stutzerimonas stutzeri]